MIINAIVFSFIVSLASASGCDQNCNDCIEDQCMECVEGYFANSGSCLSCQTFCKSCVSSNSTCTSCFDGYYQNGSTCNQCEGNCVTCSAANICTGCKLGQFVQNSQCIACSANCKTCQNNKGCSECLNRYYLVENNCLACDSSCYFCVGTSANCTLCPYSYYLVGNSCDSCSTCSDQRACIITGYCTSGKVVVSSGQPVVVVAVVPILGVIVLFIVTYSIVSKLAFRKKEEGPFSKDTIATVSQVNRHPQLESNNKIELSEGGSEDHNRKQPNLHPMINQ